MTVPDRLKGMNGEALEAWFLGAIEADPLPVAECLAVLAHLAGSGQRVLAKSWAELLQDVLPERRMDHEALQLLRMRYEWSGDSAAMRTLCRHVAGAFRTRLGKAVVKALPPDDAQEPGLYLDRLGKLFAMRPGGLCLDKTWGFGVIQRLDDFYGKITIDFTRKPNHEMTFAYASDTLDLITDEHLLARRHRDPEGMRKLVDREPAEVIRLALRSYGPLNAEQLEELLSATVLPDGGWKTFWSNARRALKADPLVEVPAKRRDPLLLLDAPRRYDTAWFRTVAEERQPKAILEAIQELEQAGGVEAADAAARSVLAERIEFVIWGDDGRQPAQVIQALTAADRLGLIRADGTLGPRAIPVDRVLGDLLQDRRVASVLEALPARHLPAFLALAKRWSPERFRDALLPSLNRLTSGTLDGVIGFLDQECGPDVVRGQMRRQSLAGTLSVAQVLWLLKSGEPAILDDVASRSELLMLAVECMEREESGDMLRARNQLRAMFEDGGWMGGQMQGLTPDQCELLLQRVRFSRGWDEVGRRTVIAGMIKARPGLAAALASGTKDPAADTPRGRFTSWRSYRERQAALKRLEEEEIPANAREIAVARSYGDLRENSEFKFAKEHQRILYRRRDETEADLNAVQGSDFKGMPTDRAGMGTCVVIRHADGRDEPYCILGEWDRDEALGIISNQSGLAKALEGHKPGDVVEIPSLTGGETCTVSSVSGLSDAVLAWLAG